MLLINKKKDPIRFFTKVAQWISKIFKVEGYLQMKNNSRQACGLDARKLLRIATENGARSLGLEHTVGWFEIGMQLDFVAFDLNSPRTASIHADELLDAIIFGAGNADIVTSAVSARVVYSR